MDDLLALMETSVEGTGVASQPDHPTKHRDLNGETTTEKYDAKAKKMITSSTVNTCLSAANGTIDPLTKIRIISRRISGVELVDILSPYQFHNTAILAFMSKYDIANLISQPSSSTEINPSGGLGGQTSMATMGVVFTNSGTRISSNNGRAFTIITIGDLHTGPTVTVMLFGHAYSKFTTMIQPGAVLAVLGSNVLPSKQGDSNKRSVAQTRITLSVRDTHQLALIGKALDYGLCSGMTKKRQYQSTTRYGSKSGGGNDGEVRCKNYVDLRMGRYCKSHSNQQHENRSSGGKPIHRNELRKNTTVLQSMRAEHDSAINRYGLGPAKSNGKSKVVSPIGKSNNLGLNINHYASSNSVSLKDSLVMVNDLIFNNGNGTTTTGYISSEPVHKSLLQRAPMHMKMMASGKRERKTNIGKIQNPYSKTTAIPSLQTSTSTRKPYKSVSTDLLGQVLGPSTNNKPRLGKHPTRIIVKKRPNIVHMEGYDGHVQVPKPHNLFSRAACPSNKVLHQATYTSPPDKVQVLHKQKSLASQMKQQRDNCRPTNNTLTSGSVSKSLSTKLNSSAEIDKMLGGSVKQRLTPEQRSKILSAKSRYSTEADAEVYAQARRLVTGLEKKENAEEQREARKKKARGHTKDSSIVVEWLCVTCQRRLSHRPSSCVSNGHIVKRQRDIKARISTVGDRLNLNKRSTADGGMVLGAGLEWTGGWKG